MHRRSFRCQRLLLILLVFSLTGLSVSAERLIIDVWCELDPVPTDTEFPMSRQTISRRLLEEARLYLSAMIYGFRFSYTPSDRIRGVEDRFELQPVAEITWGDPRLRILEMETRGEKVWAKIHYGLAAYQTARRTSWSSNTLPSTTGIGRGTLLEGVEGKKLSFQESIKQAIREYARKRVFNKPREITGEVLLWDEPAVRIGSGSYISSVKIKLFIREIIPYAVY
jgi:hypothetical protein